MRIVDIRETTVPIVSEREMKRVVLTRKNSLFVGNERGSRTAAILASLTSTCRRHAIDPQLYLTQLLVNLPSVPHRQLVAWLPDRWKQRQSTPLPEQGEPAAHGAFTVRAVEAAIGFKVNSVADLTGDSRTGRNQ